MAILIPAKVTCDEWNCGNTVEVELKVVTDERNIPSLEVENHPDGWSISSRPGRDWRDKDPCLCPTHNKPYR
jgi:hypothetical protein